ncbi:thiamine pyrophosphate-binding protein [Brevibacterium sp. ZH18]|uniref:thiamine pyrophosphate-binding protein n=1 Tax=Brevibacterium sp. ZH18 TaxID=2927784 RepID=UPI001F615936|nr:thiamine pyrophosphate-binding protein [Brevibacterium sp. ZH18]MCI4010075.1 thiamine pyrophosphate-dependent enzyme [Brevibacterium sp. ZH18]
MLNSSAVAQQIACGLVSSGVTEVVIAPGSRSAPLVYALAPLAEAGVIRTHVRIDERDAGFLALGLARGLQVRAASGWAESDCAESGRAASDRAASDRAGSDGAGAVALVTTSGSAVANLHPAVLEASYGHLPLIAITADRPARLRGTGANQTIDDQSHVLSDVRARFDVPAGSADANHLIAEAVARSVGPAGGMIGAGPGPVQFNVQFDVPLVPSVDELSTWKAAAADIAAASAGNRADTSANPGAEPGTVSSGRELSRPGMSGVPIRITSATVVVAGDAGGRSADSLRALAEEHSLPVLSEPSSPLTLSGRDLTTFVPAHARVLAERADLRSAIRTVLVHGKPTLTRPVAALLADKNVLVQRLPDDVDAADLAVSVDADRNSAEQTAWCEEWTAAGREIVAVGRLTRGSADCGTESVARSITMHLADSPINLFAASSNTIRYLSEATDVHAYIHASRGLAGIDGLVSTATGLSLALDEQVVLVIGDVAMLHDAGGLLTPSAEDEGDVVIVVLNDDGGAIFSGLEHSLDHLAGYLERYFTVPHGRNFGGLAAAYGWEYARVETLEGFLEEFEKSAVGSGDSDCSDDSAAKQHARRIIEVDLT